MFSPCANAADGAVGVSIASTRANASVEVPLDQRAHLLRAQVIRVVVAGRQHVGADHHAPPHLRAEALGARALIEVAQVRTVLAQAEAHAVIAREIRRRLGRRDDVVGRQRILGVRQRHSTISAPASRSHRRPAATAPRFPPASRRCGIPAARRSAAPHARLQPPRNPAPPRRRWWNPSDHAPPSSRAGSRVAHRLAPTAPAWSSDEANATTPQREQRP